MVESSFKIALTPCLISFYCLFFLGDFRYLAYEQLLGMQIIMLIFFTSVVSFMFSLIAIGNISGFWSLLGRGLVVVLSFGMGVFSGFIWLFDSIVSQIS